MYRNLEEERKTGLDAADAARVVCECTCKAAMEKDQPPAPDANRTGTSLQVDYDRNGTPAG